MAVIHSVITIRVVPLRQGAPIRSYRIWDQTHFTQRIQIITQQRTALLCSVSHCLVNYHIELNFATERTLTSEKV